MLSLTNTLYGYTIEVIIFIPPQGIKTKTYTFVYLRLYINSIIVNIEINDNINESKKVYLFNRFIIQNPFSIYNTLQKSYHNFL